MTTLTSLRTQIKNNEKLIHDCRQYNDWDGYERACERQRTLKNQQAAIEESLKERGTIGRLGCDENPKTLQKRRKRSAIVVGDRAQLPLTAQGNVLFPNVLLRSAVFGIWSPNRSQQTLFREQILCEGGFSIIFSGERLWQKDFLLMAVVLRMVSDDLGKLVTISVRQLLKSLGLNDGGSNYASLVDSLRRLRMACVLIQHKENETSFDGRLLDYKLIETDQGRMVELSVDVQWAELFGVARWSALELDKLVNLGSKKELAMWLAGYLTTHDGKKSISLERLYSSSGVNTERRFFRRSLKAALEDCVSTGLLLEGRLTDDEVVFCPARKRRST